MPYHCAVTALSRGSIESNHAKAVEVTTVGIETDILVAIRLDAAAAGRALSAYLVVVRIDDRRVSRPLAFVK